MSRIRNNLRFQSPEERVLNGLLVVVLALLATVAIVKARDHEAVAATEVRGVAITRSRPIERVTTTSSTVATTTTTTTTTTAPLFTNEELWILAEAHNAREGARATTTTTRPRSVAAPAPSPTTRPPAPAPTTTTTRPRPTTTTTTTTSPPISTGETG